MATTRPGDTVAVENLTWPGIQAAAAALGLELLPVPMDEHGLNPRALGRLAQRQRIAALYCMPTLQNPTARTMPIERRDAVAALARRFGFQIIEDDAYGFLADAATAKALLCARKDKQETKQTPEPRAEPEAPPKPKPKQTAVFKAKNTADSQTGIVVETKRRRSFRKPMA
ncbi:aminotransferase class I/II-fold pyridoxal phosphate-dependent enzyme [Mesorhizobium delmotii]|nr:aminotransferase class I/II-fold pyridoxal phosphate-dependent enzyme [Mesorhizobium delmotii]